MLLNAYFIFLCSSESCIILNVISIITVRTKIENLNFHQIDLAILHSFSAVKHVFYYRWVLNCISLLRITSDYSFRKENCLETRHLLRTCYSAPSCGIYMQLFPYRSSRDNSKAKYGKKLLLAVKKKKRNITNNKVKNIQKGIWNISKLLDFFFFPEVFH